MSVYPERRNGRLTGVWIAEAFDKDKERRRKRFASKLEGERWADYITLTGAPPAEEVAPVAAHPLAAVLAEAQEHHPGWEGDRDPSRKQRLTYAIDVLGKDTDVAAVDTAALDKLVASLKKRPGYEGRKRLSPGTINRYLALASAVLAFAHRRGYRRDMPAVPWQEEDGKRIHWLTEAQEDGVVAAVTAEGRGDEALSIRILTRSGLRWSEFESLEPRQVQIEKDEAWIKLDKTKTDTPRDVPIDTSSARLLLGLLERGGVPAYYTMRDTLHRAAKTAGLNMPLTPHILRHTTATRLVRAGVNLAIVQKFMGHASIQTTLKYTHVAQDDLQQALQKISPRAGQTLRAVETGAAGNAAKSGVLEATPGIEPGYTVLQTVA